MKQSLLRGKILSLLHDIYPDPIEKTSLIGIYYQYHKIELIEKALAYLEDKKLIEVKRMPHPFREREFVISYKITGDGIDLLEGNAEEEPGVLLPVEE